MRMRPLLLALGLACAAGPAFAQSCAGFSDVEASSPFCPSVEWLRNRGVTTGCGAGTTYCPNDAVTRLSMAAFMKRLGDALTPVDLPPASAGPTPGVLPNGNPVLCATADYVASGFPRRAYVDATAVLAAPSANIDVSARIVYSVGGGAWTAVGNSDQYATLYAGATPAQHATLAPFGRVDLDVGQSVRFAVQLGQFAGGGSVTVTCSTHVQVGNRTGAASPLDATPAHASRTRGG
jgi:hypothetical protein